MSALVSRDSSHSARVNSSSLRAKRPVVAEIEVLGELLRQRRAALHRAAFAQVDDRRAHHAQGVDAVVIVEALVLGGDHRVRDIARQQVERHVVVAAAALGDHRAVPRQDAHEGRVLLRPQRQRVGIDHRVIDHQPGDADTARRQRHRAAARSGAATTSACASAAMTKIGPWQACPRRVGSRLAHGAARRHPSPDAAKAQ